MTGYIQNQNMQFMSLNINILLDCYFLCIKAQWNEKHKKHYFLMNSYCTFRFYIKPCNSDSNCMEAKKNFED